MFDAHRELFIWLHRRDDVARVRFDDSSVDFVPERQTYEDGTVAPARVNVTIPRAPFMANWPNLLKGSEELALMGDSDMPELGAFALFDVHLDESVNALIAPGPNGWIYTEQGFVPF